MINAILVDDHDLFRMGLKMIIKMHSPDINIVGEAATGAAFFRMLEDTQADIVLLDIMLPDTSGIEIAQRLKKEYPNLKILVLSAENTYDTIEKMLDIGVEGFISKSMSNDNALIEAIHSIMNGFEFYGQDIAEIIHRIYVAEQKRVAAINQFTQQELRILELCQQKMLAKEIADRLNLTARTVEKHKENIFKKLGIKNTTELIRYALMNGIIR